MTEQEAAKTVAIQDITDNHHVISGKLDFQHALWMLLIRIGARFHSERMTLIHSQLPIASQRNFKTVQRTWRRPLKVQAVFIKTAAVAGALELVFSCEPARSASEMRTLGEDRINTFFLTNNPNPIFLLIFFADFSFCIV
jgi:hypothetical protein